jgi:hypothetical protein
LREHGGLREGEEEGSEAEEMDKEDKDEDEDKDAGWSVVQSESVPTAS